MFTDGLIFDLDGTLWDASAACIIAWNNSLHQLGADQIRVDEKMVAGFSGRLLDDILSVHFKNIRPDQHTEFIKLYAIEEAAQMRALGGSLYPGTRDTLEKLGLEFPLFIVSNCQKGYIENFLHQHQLTSLFKDFESSGNTGLPKKENIRFLIQRNALAKPVYIGDTSGDDEASRWNRIPFIYASYGFGTVIHPAFEIKEPGDLIALVSSS
jgi:phosphoglycolate phosphatase